MKTLVSLLVLAVLYAFAFKTGSGPPSIHWKKITTETDARVAMEPIIPAGSTFDADLKTLSAMKHSFCSGQGDTVIYFHSPEVPVHFMAMVVRKWMYTFHFEQSKMKNFTVEEGLTGP